MSPTLRYRFAGRLLDPLLRSLFLGSRYELRGSEHLEALEEMGRSCIFVLWHGRLLPLGYLHRHEGVVGLISRSSDGEYLSQLLARWGFVPVRGSSSRGGGEALREVVRHARAGRSIAITPDGPRGPRQKMKPGPIVAAQLSGLPLVPVSAGSTRGWWSGGWDRFLVPKPFSRIIVEYGAPIEVPRDLGEEEERELVQRLEDQLVEMTALIDEETGNEPPE